MYAIKIACNKFSARKKTASGPQLLLEGPLWFDSHK